MPYLIPALRLAAAAAVVGAIVAEISTGTRGGIGRLIIEYSREATSDPAKVYTAFLGAAALGLLVAGLVALLDLALSRYQPAGGPVMTGPAAAVELVRCGQGLPGGRGRPEVPALVGRRPHHRGRRVRHVHRPVRLREEHAAAADRRPDRADRAAPCG